MGFLHIQYHELYFTFEYLCFFLSIHSKEEACFDKFNSLASHSSVRPVLDCSNSSALCSSVSLIPQQ